MSAQKFACPNCDQHIEADDQYAGMQIQCPSCQQPMVVPRAEPATAPAAPPLRVTIRPSVAGATAATAAAPPHAPTAPSPSRTGYSSRPLPAGDDESRRGRVKNFALIATLVVVTPVALYFGISWAGGAQRKFNEARAKDNDPGLIGGEVGHVAELYQVMEMTDRASVRGAEEEYQQRRGKRAPGPAPAGSDATATAIVPAQWTLDVAAAKIPSGRVAGFVSGTNFVARTVVLYTGSATPILALRTGEGPSMDGELMIYLRLKPGETLEGRAWTIAKDQTAGVPQLLKRWRPNPKAPPQQQSFTGGYAMRLEFGQARNGALPGKIFLALPDAERSVAGGLFSAEVRVLNMAQGQGGMKVGAESAFEE